MTTYQETQQESDFGGMFAPPNRYNLYLACAPDLTKGYVEVAPDSDNPTKFALVDIPADIPPTRAARHVAEIAIAVHPDRLMWSAIANLPARTLLKSYRDGMVVRAPSAHWTGGDCIGWMIRN